MEQALATNKAERWIFKQAVSLLCHLCNEKEEYVYHIVYNCTPLAITKYLQQHNEIVKYLHWHMLCDRKILA
eukprot:785889-Ditylum_brightwellii.AAC.1